MEKRSLPSLGNTFVGTHERRHEANGTNSIGRDTGDTGIRRTMKMSFQRILLNGFGKIFKCPGSISKT